MLRIYEEGDHNAGFVGIRVAVMGRQRYFNFRMRDGRGKQSKGSFRWASLREENTMLREAKQLEIVWHEEMRERHMYTYKYLSFILGYRPKRGKHYPYLRCRTERKEFIKCVLATRTRGVAEAWEACARALCQRMSWPETKYRLLMKQVPTLEILDKRREQLNRKRSATYPVITKKWLLERY